jgi:hypothetical protein
MYRPDPLEHAVGVRYCAIPSSSNNNVCAQVGRGSAGFRPLPVFQAFSEKPVNSVHYKTILPLKKKIGISPIKDSM